MGDYRPKLEQRIIHQLARFSLLLLIALALYLAAMLLGERAGRPVTRAA